MYNTKSKFHQQKIYFLICSGSIKNKFIFTDATLYEIAFSCVDNIKNEFYNSEV